MSSSVGIAHCGRALSCRTITDVKIDQSRMPWAVYIKYDFSAKVNIHIMDVCINLR